MKKYYPKYIDKGIYDRVTTTIIDYPKFIIEYEDKRVEILNSSVPPQEAASKSNKISDQTGDKVIKLSNLKMLELERKINAIHRAFDDIKTDKHEIIIKRFIEQWRIDEIVCIGFSQITIKRTIEKFVKRLAFYLGEI